MAGTITIVAGDAQLTVTIAAIGAGDLVEVAYRTPTGSWALGGSRTGPGDVVIAGLTNGQVYEVLQTVTVTDNSDPVTSTPTDGSNTPDGPLSLAVDRMRDLFANSATWQALTGSGSVAEAKTHTYCATVPSSVDDETELSYQATLAAARPYALVGADERMEWPRIAGGTLSLLQAGGDLVVLIEIDIPAAYKDDDVTDDAMQWFYRQIDAIINDWRGDVGGEGKLSVTNISTMAQPVRLGRKDASIQSDFFIGLFQVSWGV